MVKADRNEWKYLISEADAARLTERIAALLERDSHAERDGNYLSHSLYFDDHNDSCARDNAAGVNRRHKYRIRYYGTNSHALFLERKEKTGARCRKDVCPLTAAEYGVLLTGNCSELLWCDEKKLLQRFTSDLLCNDYAPKAIIRYRREAFVEPISNIRITFDRDVAASVDFPNFLENDVGGIPVVSGKQVILEIKFDCILPSYIRRLLQADSLLQQACSKYYMGRRAVQSAQ